MWIGGRAGWPARRAPPVVAVPGRGGAVQRTLARVLDSWGTPLASSTSHITSTLSPPRIGSGTTHTGLHRRAGGRVSTSGQGQSNSGQSGGMSGDAAGHQGKAGWRPGQRARSSWVGAAPASSQPAARITHRRMQSELLPSAWPVEEPSKDHSAARGRRRRRPSFPSGGRAGRSVAQAAGRPSRARPSEASGQRCRPAGWGTYRGTPWGSCWSRASAAPWSWSASR